MTSVESSRFAWLNTRTVDRLRWDPDDFENAAHIGRWNADRLTTVMLDRLSALSTRAV